MALFDTPTMAFEPTRSAGLARLNQSAPKAGRAYASERNYDRGPGRHKGVSLLSPYTRHRLVTEREILRATLERHSQSAAEKFISEVLWRTYFKGNLERHPSVWAAYKRDVARERAAMAKDGALRHNVTAAEAGETGIDAFDSWANELVETGYMHNHARMWFASIWMFTLRLPWSLGADFFLRHLIDGDAASNTLSWRWVGGLHTKGKNYIARTDNIARYTDGRFKHTDVAPHADPLDEFEDHPSRSVPQGDALPHGEALWVITEDECSSDPLPVTASAVLATTSAELRAPHGGLSEDVQHFTADAVRDALKRITEDNAIPAADNGHIAPLTAERIMDAADAAGTKAIAMRYVPIGPAADALAAARPTLEAEGYTIHQILRKEDAKAWHHADRGFFKVKKAIPKLIAA